MNKQALIDTIRHKKSFLCVGLDTDIDRIPKKFLQYDNPVLTFNKAIIDITAPHCVAYKPNAAFYERYGWEGVKTLQETLDYIPKGILKIVDAKRGDIGNTSAHYARAVFDTMNADAITVAPYMGRDSVTPFFEWKNKWVILLAVTSNEGSQDFQMLHNVEGQALYEKVVEESQKWGSSEQMMFVVGATVGEHIERVRSIAPDYFFLVPGVGAQGGSLSEVARLGMTRDCGLLVNASRSIIYADNSANFEDAVATACQSLQGEMSQLLSEHGVI